MRNGQSKKIREARSIKKCCAPLGAVSTTAQGRRLTENALSSILSFAYSSFSKGPCFVNYVRKIPFVINGNIHM